MLNVSGIGTDSATIRVTDAIGGTASVTVQGIPFQPVPAGATTPTGITTAEVTSSGLVCFSSVQFTSVLGNGAAAQLTDLAAASRATGAGGEKLARLAEGARAALTPGVPPNTVCTLLNSFRSSAQAMVTTRQLTQAQAQPLIADAVRIRTLLGCP